MAYMPEPPCDTTLAFEWGEAFAAEHGIRLEVRIDRRGGGHRCMVFDPEKIEPVTHRPRINQQDVTP